MSETKNDTSATAMTVPWTPKEAGDPPLDAFGAKELVRECMESVPHDTEVIIDLTNRRWVEDGAQAFVNGISAKCKVLRVLVGETTLFDFFPCTKQVVVVSPLDSDASAATTIEIANAAARITIERGVIHKFVVKPYVPGVHDNVRAAIKTEMRITDSARRGHKTSKEVYEAYQTDNCQKQYKSENFNGKEGKGDDYETDDELEDKFQETQLW